MRHASTAHTSAISETFDWICARRTISSANIAFLEKTQDTHAGEANDNDTYRS
jgi:hypothetical protein